MNSKPNPDRNLLFDWACKGLKFFLLMLLGLAIAFMLSQVFGSDTIVQALLSSSVWEWIGRIGVLIFCSFAVAMIYESSR